MDQRWWNTLREVWHGTFDAPTRHTPKDDRYPGMLAHLAGMKPGEQRAITPFPEPVIDPDSV
jgi:hypothetical protein